MIDSVEKIGSCVVSQAQGLIWVILRGGVNHRALINYAGFVMHCNCKISLRVSSRRHRPQSNSKAWALCPLNR